MSKDCYNTFDALKAREREGVDYRICVTDRASPVTIVAPHGGHIEPITSRIAAAIAGDTFSLYCFEGLRPGRAHCELHITSSKFDEPKCLELVRGCRLVVAVHGRKDNGDKVSIWLGGLDTVLRDAMSDALKCAGYQTMTSGHKFSGTELDNICNRGKSGAGVQLELPMKLRKELHKDGKRLNSFATAARVAVDRRLKTPP